MVCAFREICGIRGTLRPNCGLSGLQSIPGRGACGIRGTLRPSLSSETALRRPNKTHQVYLPWYRELRTLAFKPHESYVLLHSKPTSFSANLAMHSTTLEGGSSQRSCRLAWIWRAARLAPFNAYSPASTPKCGGLGGPLLQALEGSRRLRQAHSPKWRR